MFPTGRGHKHTCWYLRSYPGFFWFFFIVCQDGRFSTKKGLNNIKNCLYDFLLFYKLKKIEGGVWTQNLPGYDFADTPSGYFYSPSFSKTNEIIEDLCDCFFKHCPPSFFFNLRFLRGYSLLIKGTRDPYIQCFWTQFSSCVEVKISSTSMNNQCSFSKNFGSSPSTTLKTKSVM